MDGAERDSSSRREKLRPPLQKVKTRNEKALVLAWNRSLEARVGLRGSESGLAEAVGFSSRGPFQSS